LSIPDNDIYDLPIEQILPALGSKVSLDPRSSQQFNGQSQSPLLKYLADEHKDALSSLVCLDLTVYEYGLEHLPFFHLIAAEGAFSTYKNVVIDLVTPKVLPGDETNKKYSYSVAINKDFIGKDRITVISFDEKQEQSIAADKTKEVSTDKLIEEHYQLREYSPTAFPTVPKISDALNEFKGLLSDNRHELCSVDGNQLSMLICCNFRVAEDAIGRGFRTLGQIFLGISTPISRTTTGEIIVPASTSRLIADLACLLFRTNSAGLALTAASNYSRDIFTHEAKKLVNLVHSWPKNIESCLGQTGDPVDVAALRLANLEEAVDVSNTQAIVLPQYFDAALAQMRLWTMSENIGDLPFEFKNLCNSGSTEGNLHLFMKACYEAAKDQNIFAFMLKSRLLQVSPSKILALESYLKSKLPKLNISNGTPAFKLSPNKPEELTDLSRFLIVVFREAIQHGDWKEHIQCKFRNVVSDGIHLTLELEISNNIWLDPHESNFSDIPSGFPLSEKKLCDIRKGLHTSPLSCIRVGRRGRRQLSFFLDRTNSGSVLYVGQHENTPIWSVLCRLNSKAFSS